MGEQTGALPQMLNSVAEFFEEDVATALTAALALIEPAILIVMGVVVVFILISLYLPIFSLGQAGRRSGVNRYGRHNCHFRFRRADAGQREERAQAEALARRYHAEFVDLKNFKIQHDLLRTVPVELMFRYNFVPIEQQEDALVIAVSDPSRLMVLDEIAGLLGQRIVARVATLSQITDLLKKTEQSQRVLDEASEGLTFDVLTGEDNSDENISIEKLTSDEDISPIIRLVDTTIFTALERRASDIHIETYDDSVHREVPHRRRAAGGHGADCARAPHDDSEPHQDHERAGHCRAPRAAGRALPGALQGPADRFPRLDHADRSRRKCRAARARQGVDEREVPAT